MKTKFKILLGTSILFLLAGCSANNKPNANYSSEAPYDMGSRGESSNGGGYYDTTSPKSGESGESGHDAEPPMVDTGSTSSEGEENSTTTNQNRPEPGQLTCSALDDNKDFEYWRELQSTNQTNVNKYYGYRNNYAFNAYNRLALNVINGKDIKVKIKDTEFETCVDNFNKAYLFPTIEANEYNVEISYVDASNQTQTLEKTVKDGDTVDLEQTFSISNYLQIMFVIDATGSMGDEIKYLQSEIDDVITKVKAANANANVELAIMMYRDVGQYEEYLIRYNDFTTDIAAQKTFLAAQRASGGGDIPEAVDQALTEAVDKQWSNNATKLLFFVADAPAHDKDVGIWNDAVKAAAAKGIKIITVASSGIDTKTEYFFRCQSVITGGQYVFITNDSGIGGDHLIADTREKLPVEYLNSCLIRLVNGYFTGVMAEPIPYQQENQQQMA